MTIIHISTKNTWGGGEKQVWYLLNELRKKGVEQILVCAKNSAIAEKCKAAKFNIIELPKGLLFTVAWSLRLKKIVQQYSKPILHAHDGQAHNLALAHSILSRLQTPIVVHRRIIKNSYNAYKRMKFNHPAIRRIICISSAVRESLLPIVEDHSKLVLIPSGIDTANLPKVSMSKEGVKASLGIAPDSKLIVNIGALVPQKQQETFFNAAKIFFDKNPKALESVHFAAIGDGPLRSKLEAVIMKFGLNRNCRILGFTKTVQDIIAASDILVSTSVDEALGNVIMEAFLIGTPVIATNSGGIRDLIDHEITGLLVKPLDEESFANYFSLLLTNPELSETFRRNAFEKISKFSIVNIANEMYKTYASIE